MHHDSEFVTDAQMQDNMLMCMPADPSNKNPEENWSAAAYFIDEFVRISDESSHSWIRFRLWPKRANPLEPKAELSPGQWEALKLLFCNGRVIILKARQLGLTWLCLAIILWHIVFIPHTTVMLYSLREIEAKKLLQRLKGMFAQLPWYFKDGMSIEKENESEWRFTNGTTIMAFSTESGDSYQASIVLMDEATLVPHLMRLIGRVEPTLENVENGQFWMISRANKLDPMNVFNKMFLAGVKRIQKGDYEWRDWVAMFLPWWVAPNRDAKWYEQKVDQADNDVGHRDELYAMFPATPSQALAAAESSKRLVHKWIDEAYIERYPLKDIPLPYPDLRVYYKPEQDAKYFCGVDSAEGLVGGDNSVAVWVNEQGVEQAILCGKIPPDLLADWVHHICQYFNDAPIMCERLNHGHAVILKLNMNGSWLLDGLDERPGWLSSKQGKIDMYTRAADVLHHVHLQTLTNNELEKLNIELSEETPHKLIHSWDMALELKSIERLTLRAPEGMHDDMADAWTLAQCARLCDYPAGVEKTGYYMC